MASGLSRKLSRAAAHRLAAAETLLQSGRKHNLDVMYLAGYGVECSLKALLLARNVEIGEYLRGRKGHNLESLKELLKNEGCNFPREVAEAFRLVRTWTTDLRYESQFVPTKDAERFFAAAILIRQWVDRSL